MNAELHPPRRARRGNQEALIAWLDEQERILRMRGVPAELVQEFDPIHNLPEEPPEVVEGRRTLEIKFNRFGGLNLESSIADQINRSTEERVQSRFKLEITSWIQLQNIEDGSTMDWYNTDLGESPWFETLVASREWVGRQEESRLSNLNRPNTKWSYNFTKVVYVKVILDRHPLFLGLGRLPDWLRNKHGVLSLDTYDDNLCLFRCIAVHQGATPRRNMRKTRELENSFFTQRPDLRNRLTDKHLSLLEKHFKQGIAAYTVQPNNDFLLTHDLFYESEHVPISVSLADTLNPEPEYIVSRDPAELIRLFHQSLERRHTAIVAAVVAEFSFSDTEGISEKQGEEIVKWFHQVPVLGFNSGHYDLKLIRQHFIPLLAQDPGTFAAEKNGRIMFINTPKFKFLDVLNYLGPGITYEKWVKTYGATLAKSWLPYEWFDSPDKLDFPGLPPYMAWYSKLKGEYVLTLKEYDDCHRIFKERGMQTFGDWLEYYNNLDVAPFLEALQKMKEFYTSLGIDILKDAVSLPGVSEKYILRKTLQPRWGYKPPELYSPNKEAYAMLKAAVVGGPSLVFTRKHVAGETRIRSHQYEDAKVCRRILGYDANSLYPSTMMKEMPCGPGFVKSYDNPEAYARVFPQFLWMEEWFGFAEVDIEVPEELWPEFEEFPPLFINRGVPDSAVPQHMHDYLQQSGRKRFPEQKKLLGVMSAKKILLYAPLLAWYLNQGLKLTAVHRTIDYEPREIFSWFVNEVANNRRKGDAEKDKALLAEVFKLLGNSAYGKFIEAVERHTNTIYTCDEEEVDKSLRSARFKTLEEIGPAYKVELRKSKITIDRPFQVGIVVYQLAKLRMLQFYYEFLDFYLDRRDFELIQMDTDSMYFALSHERLEDAIRPGYETQFEEEKKRWLAWNKWSNREPGLFKLEKEATSGIALCSKCYHMEDQATGKAKVSSKGVNKRQNEMRRERFERALAGDRDVVVNRGFRMRDGAMYTYEQRKLGLSAYYDKRWVLPDGIHTEPLEYHQ